MLRQLVMNAAQDFRTGLDDHQANVGAGNPAIATSDIAMHEVVQFTDEFDAGVTAADNHKRQQLSPELGIFGVIGVFEDIEDMLAQDDSVLERLEVAAILRRAGNAKMIRAAAERNDQRVIFQRAGIQIDAPRVQVDCVGLIASKPEAAPTANVAYCLHDVARIDVARCNLREERSEQEEVLLVYQNHFDVRTPVKLLLQFEDGLQSAKPAAEHDDTFHDWLILSGTCANHAEISRRSSMSLTSSAGLRAGTHRKPTEFRQAPAEPSRG